MNDLIENYYKLLYYKLLVFYNIENFLTSWILTKPFFIVCENEKNIMPLKDSCSELC